MYFATKPRSDGTGAGAAARSSGNDVIGIRHDCGLVVLGHGRDDGTIRFHGNNYGKDIKI